eukprot:g31015.t1
MIFEKLFAQVSGMATVDVIRTTTSDIMKFIIMRGQKALPPRSNLKDAEGKTIKTWSELIIAEVLELKELETESVGIVAELEAKGVDLELQQRGPSVAIVAAGDEVNMEATITILLLFQHFFAGPNTSDTCSGAP